jgi:hypothetical protein
MDPFALDQRTKKLIQITQFEAKKKFLRGLKKCFAKIGKKWAIILRSHGFWEK